jgi:hypothetical protein
MKRIDNFGESSEWVAYPFRELNIEGEAESYTPDPFIAGVGVLSTRLPDGTMLQYDIELGDPPIAKCRAGLDT